MNIRPPPNYHGGRSLPEWVLGLLVAAVVAALIEGVLLVVFIR
jgi:hypothetical protein